MEINSLYTALSGIQATQQLLNTTTRNITNSQTPGYTLKTQQAVSNAATGGVLTSQVQRYVDASLQQKQRTTTAQQFYDQVRSDALTQMDQLSGNPANGTSISSKIDALDSAFQQLATAPQSASSAQNVLAAAQDLAQTLNQQTNALQSLQTTAAQNVTTDVVAVNKDLQQIASLNQQVVSAQANGKDPTDLQDQRDNAVNDLSKYMNVNAFTDNQGVLQVYSGDFHPLAGLYAEIVTNNQVNNTLSTSAGQLNNVGGQIGGNLQVLTGDTVQRLQNLSEVATQLTLGLANNLPTSTLNLTGTLTSVPATTSGTVTAQLNTDSGNGYTATLQYVATGATTYNLVATALTPIGSAPGVTVPAGGIALGSLDMSTTPPTFSGTKAALPATVASQPPGNIGPLSAYTTGLSVGANAPGAITPNNGITLFTQSSGALPPAGPYNPPYYSGNIEVNPSITARQLQVGDALKNTATDNNVGAAQAAQSLLTNNQFTFTTNGIAGTQTIKTAADSMIVGIGQDLANTKSQITQLTTYGTQLTQAMAPQSEVNLDTEMSKLVVLQNLYASNARVVSTVDKMLDALISLPV